MAPSVTKFTNMWCILILVILHISYIDSLRQPRNYKQDLLVKTFDQRTDAKITRSSSKPEKFVVNLNLPALDRWKHIVTRKPYVDLVPKLKEAIKSIVPDFVFPLIENITAQFDDWVSEPYSDEMKGIAKNLNMRLGDVVGANLLYDFTAFCTSTVLQDDSGRIWHARNLDYRFTDLLKNLTIVVDFQRNNKTVYRGVTFAGYIGILTGLRPNAFTVTLNERDQGGWWENLLEFLIHYKSLNPVGFLMRDTLEKSESFTDAVERITDTPTEASFYAIIGGVNINQGVVITKGREFPIDIWRLDPPTRWFVVETNYDHWLPPPVSDDRRNPAIDYLNAMGPANVTVSSLLNVMASKPVLNKDTVYTVVMSASELDFMDVWVWRGSV